MLDGHRGLRPAKALGHVLIAATERPPREGERADDSLSAQGQPHEVRVAEGTVGGDMLGRHADQKCRGVR